jgi:serine/threonine protein kinase
MSMHVDTNPASRIGPSDFEILGEIGSGSFAEVYLVKHKLSGKHYAMKSLKKVQIIGKKLERYALIEKNILKEADHPFLIKLHWSF